MERLLIVNCFKLLLTEAPDESDDLSIPILLTYFVCIIVWLTSGVAGLDSAVTLH